MPASCQGMKENRSAFTLNRICKMGSSTVNENTLNTAASTFRQNVPTINFL